MDNSILCLQQRGGISTYWNEVLKVTMHKDLDVVTNAKLVRRLARIMNRIDFLAPLLTLLLKLCPIILSNRCEIVHTSYYRRPWFGFKGLYVITIHDMIPEMYFTGLQRKLAVFYKRRAILRADRLICVSDTTKKDLLRFYPGIDRAMVTTIHHGSRKSVMSLKERNVNQILYIGRRSEKYKGFMKLVRSLKNSNYTLVIVGSALTKTEKSEVQKVLHNRFVSMVFPTNQTVDALLKSSIALLYPSEYEGFGLPVLEAMSLGTPVVCNDTKVFRELFSDAAIFTNFEDSGQVLASLNLVKERLNEISQKCIELNERYSWDKSRLSLIHISEPTRPY